jgi:hypothetical protein
MSCSKLCLYILCLNINKGINSASSVITMYISLLNSMLMCVCVCVCVSSRTTTVQ